MINEPRASRECRGPPEPRLTRPGGPGTVRGIGPRAPAHPGTALPLPRPPAVYAEYRPVPQPRPRIGFFLRPPGAMGSTVDLDRHTIAAALAPQMHRLATPALLLDLDAVDLNIAAVVRRAGARRWRPHLKTLKSSALIERLLAADVTRWKVATLDELDLALGTADKLGREADVLLAYPQHPAALKAARERAAASPRCRVQFVLDSLDHAAQLGHAVAVSTPMPVQLDVDLGMGRTGSTVEHWRAALPALLQDPGLEITGLHGYDGHLAWDERDAANAAYDSLCALARVLVDAGLTNLEIVTSGTHSYAAALAHRGLSGGPWQHTISPGTVVLADLRSPQAMADLDLRQAAFVATRVISRGVGRVTLDAGSKALAPDRPASSNHILGWPGLAPTSASEEHLVVQVASGAEVPALGELVLVVPDHVCTTVNLYRQALLLRAGAIAGEAAIEAAGHRLWLTGADA